MSRWNSVVALLKTFESIDDPEEETFALFSQQIPSSNLGFVDAKATTLDLEIGKRTISITQSPGLLNSDRTGGTTGAVLWKISPEVAEWLSDSTSVFWKHHCLSSDSVVAELGCGISGLIGLALHHNVQQYILTDQIYVMKALRQNVAANTLHESKQGKKSSHIVKANPDNLHLLSFDWESDSASNLMTVAGNQINGIDFLIACDCIYNDFLISPFVQACKDICQLRKEEKGAEGPTLLLVAQQQRSSDVFEGWLKATIKHFQVWRVPDAALPATLRAGSGYSVHVAVLKNVLS